MKTTVIASLLLFTVPISTLALVVADYNTATNTPPSEWNVDGQYVYCYEGMSAVAVGSHWLMTAAHTAMRMQDSTVMVDGTPYYEQDVVLHSADADLALVRFDKPFPGYYPLYTGSFPTNTTPDQRLPCVIIGHGNTGSVHNTFYRLSENGGGTRRWGSNKIDGEDTLRRRIHDYRTDPKGGVYMDTVSDGILIGFNQAGTAYEAGADVRDSGGGIFVEEGGVWKLAGINSAVLSAAGGSPDITFAVSVPAYETWITQTVGQADGDDDSDGIPNWWEEEQSGSTTGVVALVDQDGDGFSGQEEWIADTGPGDSSSFTELSASTTATSQEFSFIGSSARKYRLYYATNDLADPALEWVPHADWSWGEGIDTFITTSNTEDKVFYRLHVTMP